jgi:hypothetical protein
VPPLDGVTVNDTFVPLQTVSFGMVVIVKDGTMFGVTVIVMLLLRAVSGTAHARLLVSLHDIISPVLSVLVVYVELLLPTTIPFLRH